MKIKKFNRIIVIYIYLSADNRLSLLAQPMNLNICTTKVGKTILNHGVPVSLSAGVMDTEDPLRVRKAGGAGVRVGRPTAVGLTAVTFYI